MKKVKVMLGLALCTLMLQVSSVVMAQNASKPSLYVSTYDDGALVQKISDNGRWGVAQALNSEKAESGIAKVVDLQTHDVMPLQTAEDRDRNGVCYVSDVTDDGNVVVGEYRGKPAYWLRTTNTWTTLPVPQQCVGGAIAAVSADGHWAVGSGYFRNEYEEVAVVWDLQKGEIVELTNIPQKDIAGENKNQMRATSISGDGRYAVLSMSFSYLTPLSPTIFVYDIQENTYKCVGYDYSDKGIVPQDPELLFIEGGMMSPDGHWLTGTARMYTSTADISTDIEVPMLYDVHTGEMHIYREREAQGMMGTAVDNNGTVYAATPTASPLREWYVLGGGYWYNFGSLLTQAYGMNYHNATGFYNTGTVMSVDGEGHVMSTMVDPQYGEGYVMTLTENLAGVASGISLLGNYSITPAEGSRFTRLKSVSVLFDRAVQVIGDEESAVLKGENGEVISTSAGINVDVNDPNAIVVTFWSTTLEDGEKYTVEIPAGVISVKGDKEQTNNTISVNYTGRANVPVKAEGVYPADGSELMRIDNGSNPVIVTMDAEVVLTEKAEAYMTRVSDNTKVKMNVLTNGSRVLLYPLNAQMLYLDEEYVVTLAAGSLTDISGRGGNEELNIHYTGTYERVVNPNDAIIFTEDFNNNNTSYNNMIRYEGDHNMPTEAMKAWAFDADNTPWDFRIRDTRTSPDMCAGSHSMYQPAGKSDDWMMTYQLYIPDEYCNLSFKAQSYKKKADDHLKVYVWATDDVHYVLNAEKTAQIRNEAELVFDEKLSPGLSEEELEDDWTNYRVSLAKYAGRSVYVAFVNDNEDQSAVFVDDIMVKRNMKYLISLKTEESVVLQEEVPVTGALTINSDDDVFTSLTLTLRDANENVIDEISESGMNLKKNDRYEFAFAQKLPLTSGVENKYYIDVKLDDYTDRVKSTVKNLAFNPVKRAVLEEMTGTTCPNCPRGIVAIENLEKIYGDQFIPVSIHAYTGDPYGGNGIESYARQLGLLAAPTGMVCRNGYVAAPMDVDPMTFKYTFNNGASLWADYVAQELQKPADADVSAEVSLNDDDSYDVNVKVTYALTAKNLNLNIFFTLLEDGIISTQDNNQGGTSDPLLGDWGLGGRYSSSTNYNVTHNDVVRDAVNSVNGVSGYFPQTMAAGEVYEAELNGLSIPGTADPEHLKAVVMIIDGNTGRYINAAVTTFPGYVSGIRDVEDGTATARDGVTYYTPSGMQITSADAHHGVMIVKTVRNGKAETKKVIVK